MEFKHSMVNGLIRRNGIPMQCPFRAPVSYINQSPIAGKQAELKVLPYYCGLTCPLFEQTGPTKVCLHCSNPVTEYHVEIIEATKPKGNA